MQKNKFEAYLAPEVEVNCVMVECGIAASSQLVDPDENPELGWD